MKTKASYIVLLVLTASFFSCTTRKCSTGFPFLRLQGFSPSELEVIEIKEYEPGSGWNKLKHIYYIGDSVKTKIADSIPGKWFRMNALSFYEVRILKTNTSYSIHDFEDWVHKYKESILGGEPPACVNGYSYWVNTKYYKVAFRENVSSSPSGYDVPVTVNKE